MKPLPAGLAVVTGLTALVCGGGSGSPTAVVPPPTTLASRAAITLSVNPNPVIAVAADPSIDPGFDWLIRWDLTVDETAGLGGNVNFVNGTLQDVVSGLEFLNPVNYGADYVIRRGGTNHLTPRGKLTIPMQMVYFLIGHRRHAIATLVVSFTDDRGNEINTLVRFEVL